MSLEKFRSTLMTGAVLVSCMTAPPPVGAAAAEEPPEVTHDGLHRLPESEVALAYVRPDTDFSRYDKVMILDVYVAFRANWQRDQNRGSIHRLTNLDVERMKKDVAGLFREVFVETLEADDGFPVVEAADTNVLLLRPAIIDLDITAPDTNRGTRSTTFAASAGEATLYLELFDSVSGQILARALDRQMLGRPGGFMTWTNRVTNRADGEKVLKRWAGLLRQRLEEVHGGAADED